MQPPQILASFKLINFFSSFLNNGSWLIALLFISTLRWSAVILTFVFTRVLYKKSAAYQGFERVALVGSGLPLELTFASQRLNCR